MRALTVTQPWAGLIASGIKLVENRSRRMAPRDLFGQRFAIHAGRNVDFGTCEELINELSYSDEHTYYVGDRIATRPAFDNAMRLWHITSSVIAVATLDRAVVEWRAGSELESQRRWFTGPIGYVLRDVIALPTPVPCRGWQGFWVVPHLVEQAITAQLARAA